MKEYTWYTFVSSSGDMCAGLPRHWINVPGGQQYVCEMRVGNMQMLEAVCFAFFVVAVVIGWDWYNKAWKAGQMYSPINSPDELTQVDE